MWFAAFGNYQQHPWLLISPQNCSRAIRSSGLLAHDPFLSTGNGPPTLIRAEHYSYTLSPPGTKSVWTRERLGEYFPPVHLNNPSLRKFIVNQGWAWDYDSSGGETGSKAPPAAEAPRSAEQEVE